MHLLHTSELITRQQQQIDLIKEYHSQDTTTNNKNYIMKNDICKQQIWGVLTVDLVKEVADILMGLKEGGAAAGEQAIIKTNDYVIKVSFISFAVVHQLQLNLYKQ